MRTTELKETTERDGGKRGLKNFQWLTTILDSKVNRFKKRGKFQKILKGGYVKVACRFYFLQSKFGKKEN